MEQNKALAKRLKELMEEKGESYRSLADKCNLPIRRLQRMGMGMTSNPSVFIMMRICDTLGVTLDEFFGTDDFKELDN